MKLDEAVAVVIGGASGMGRTYCEMLLKKGAKVLIADIQRTSGQETADSLASTYDPDHVAFRRCNGACEDEIRDVLLEAKSRWSRLDIVINHVGTVDEVNWKRLLEINVGSAILTARITEEILGKNNGGPGGIMIITASRAGVIPSPWMPVYSASKAAIVHYIRVLMHPLHYKRHGIRMMAVCPGITKTNFIYDAKNEAKVGVLCDKIKQLLKDREDADDWVKAEWVGETLITLLENDEEMAGVAAVVNSKTPEFHFKDEHKNVN